MKTWPDLTQIERGPGRGNVLPAIAGELSLTSSTEPAIRRRSSVEAVVTSIRSPGGEAALAVRPGVALALVVASVVVASVVTTFAGTLLVILRDHPGLALTILVAAYIRWGLR